MEMLLKISCMTVQLLANMTLVLAKSFFMLHIYFRFVNMQLS